MDKIKIIMLVLLLAASCLAGGVLAWKAKKKMCLKKIREQELEIERMKKQKSHEAYQGLLKNMEMLAGQQAPPLQETRWRAKGDEQEIKELPPDCEKCFEKVKREVVVKDDKRGWWEYRDPDVLDDEPGEMELKPKLFADTSLPSSKSGGTLTNERERGEAIEKRLRRQDRPGVFFAKPETSLKVATGLHAYEIELAYSPLRLEGNKADLSVVVGSRLQMDHHTSELRGDVTAGIEVAW